MVSAPVSLSVTTAPLGPARYLAGVAGAGLVAVFLQTVVRHPAEGFVAAVACGFPMVWLIQFARTGAVSQLASLGWYGAWYAVFAVGWWLTRDAQGAPWETPLGPQASIGVFLGSVAIVGGASRARYWRARFRWRR